MHDHIYHMLTYQRTSGQHARAACLVFTWGMKTTVDRMGVKEESPCWKLHRVVIPHGSRRNEGRHLGDM